MLLSQSKACMFVVGTLLSNLNTFFSPDLTIRVSCIDVIVTVNDTVVVVWFSTNDCISPLLCILTRYIL